MKKLILSLLIIILTFVFICTGCNSKSDEDISKDIDVADRIFTETQEPFKITYVYEDYNLIEKTVYNSITKITTNYYYIYFQDGWGCNLTEVQVITVDENGNVISQSNK